MYADCLAVCLGCTHLEAGQHLGKLPNFSEPQFSHLRDSPDLIGLQWTWNKLMYKKYLEPCLAYIKSSINVIAAAVILIIIIIIICYWAGPWMLTFFNWLLSLSMLFLRFIYAVACIKRALFLFMVEYYSTVLRMTHFVYHFISDGRWSCFHLWAIMNNNCCEHLHTSFCSPPFL